MNSNSAKKAAGYAAADLIQDGMKVGLGTGSTAAFFIEKLAEKCRKGLHIIGIPTSKASQLLAEKYNIPTGNIDDYTTLDVDVDGADEIDSKKQMIKGGGGALLREKIIAKMSKEMIVIVDNQKVVKKLGNFPLPIEIIPFGWRATVYHIQHQGFEGLIRKNSNGDLYITDNGNYIIDLKLPEGTKIEDMDQRIREIPGVVETGFFSDYAGRVIVGYPDGKVEIRT